MEDETDESSGSYSDEDEVNVKTKSILLRDAITHIFLTKRTPDKKNPNLERIEKFLLETFYKSVKEATIETPFPELNSTVEMLRNWTHTQPMSKRSVRVKLFRDKVSNIQDGQTLPIYLRNQNCTMLFTKQVGYENLQISTFRSSLPAATVMSAVGSQSLDFPETIELVRNKNLAYSKAFAELLYELAVGEIHTLGKITKGETDFDETRDAADPRLISDWIVGMLVPDHGSEDCIKTPGAQITKKVRDQVTLLVATDSSNDLPFRRSGLYTSLKVTLQLKLLEIFDNLSEAKLAYKILMLHVLTDICQAFLSCYQQRQNEISIDMDLGSQMLAKLGGRVKKLENCKMEPSRYSEKIEEFKYNCLDMVESVTERLSRTMQMCWNKISFPIIIKEQRKTAVSHVSDYVNWIDHDIGGLNEYISILSIAPSPISKRDVEGSPPIKRYPKLSDLIKGSNNKVCVPEDELSLKVWLYDVETWVKYKCGENINQSQLFALITKYVEIASKAYKNNPLGVSQIFLVTLKALYLLHKKTTSLHPLLREYKTEIDCDIFDNLILPYQKDMKLLEELVIYFSLFELQAKHGGIMSHGVTENSFSARFAAQNPIMKMFREEILKEAEKKIAEKLVEVTEIRSKCKDLQGQISKEGICKCEYETEQKKNRHGELYIHTTTTKIPPQCKKCDLQDKLRSKRKLVSTYQRPLPNREARQFAVVFELAIPEEMAIWRDLFAYFKCAMLGEHMCCDARVKWIQYLGKLGYKSTLVKDRNVWLGSKHLPMGGLYLTKTQEKDVLLNDRDSDFVLNNCMSLHYDYEFSYYGLLGTTSKVCTFQLSSTAGSAPYSNLQASLASTNHTQNEIIASQYTCSKNLSPEEFLAFGSVRAGHRIQWRNLYQAIYTGTLSLEKEPALALILQTIWQFGPRDEQNTPEAHLDIQNTNFAEEFVEMLDKIVNCRANYSCPLIVLNVIIIARRISELNTSLVDKCYETVKKWRQILSNWEHRVTDELCELSGHEDPTGRVISLKKLDLQINLCYLYSFGIGDSSNFKSVIRDKEDVIIWLKAIHQNYVLTIEEKVESSDFLGILIDHAKSFPLRLRLQEEERNEFLPGLHYFVMLELVNCKYESGTISGNQRFNLKYTEIGSDENVSTHVVFNILTGERLIDGNKDSMLSPTITGSTIFKRYFRKVTTFRVQSTRNVYVSVENFRGRKYEFHYNKMYKLPIIKEIRKNNSKLILLDTKNEYLHYQLSNSISDCFIDNYTHWLDMKTNNIYFRHDDATSNDDYHYELQKASGFWRFYDIRKNQYIYSIQSEVFKRVTHSLQTLEIEEYINVSVSSNKLNRNVITVHLRRLNINFTLQAKGCLESVEYPGFSLCKNQGIRGTLIGLKQGVVLRCKRKRIILIPHSTIHIMDDDRSSHHKTGISMADLRQPPFFVYEFDDVLKRIKAHNSKSAWIYLAALHAATSSSLPDSFTLMTGTEMAMRILQSARVWSCSPYDEEALISLRFIKSLSPRRFYYGIPDDMEKLGSMETTKWPRVISSMAAYDGLAIIVDKLIRDSNRLSKLYTNSQEAEARDDTPSSELLRIRAYCRYQHIYNPVASIDKNEHFTPTTGIHIASVLLGLNGATSLPLRSEQQNAKLRPLTDISFSRIESTFIINLMESGKFKKDNLSNYLGEVKLLEPSLPGWSKCGMSRFLDLIHLDFGPNWLRVYEMATNCTTKEYGHLLTIILSSFAYRGTPIEQLVNLHVVSSFTKAGIKFPKVPINTTGGVIDLTNCDFQNSQVEKVLERQCKPFMMKEPKRPSERRYSSSAEARQKYESALEAYQTAKETFEQNCKEILVNLTEKIKTKWSCEQTWEDLLNEYANSTLINITHDSIGEINKYLQTWLINLQTKRMIEDVQQILNALHVEDINSGPSNEIPYQLQNAITTVYSHSHHHGNNWDMHDFINKNIRKEQLVKICLLFKLGRNLGDSRSASTLQLQRKRHLSKIKELTDEIHQMTTVTCSARIMKWTGIIPRICPTILLMNLLRNSEGEFGVEEVIWKYAGALAVLWTQLNKINRCMEAQENDLELENNRRTNWSPDEHPEWLLLELEMNITIREVQVNVAKQMIQMPDRNNGVTQLNMGQGKTSVIVPMLCSTLAKSNSQLCRVTVLSAMFKMNLNSLTFSLGGLLNRRVYTFPCRRDIEFNVSLIGSIRRVYEECLKEKGVVLVLPEHRLSLRLLAYDKISKEERSLGLKILEVENWLRKYARDVLDESDELLSVKYQLVYTVGNQVKVEGGDMRWIICQEILQIVQKVGRSLWENHGGSVVEYENRGFVTDSNIFVPLRVLSQSCIKELTELVAESFVELLWRISPEEREIVKKFLIQNQGSRSDHVELMQVIRNIFTDSPEDIAKVLLVSGYLRRGVLGLALTKRWRVEYGVNPKQGFRRMAVPFLAKDVASEKTEFGHPDLAIILTHLSYYYSGLNDAHLEEIFKYIKEKYQSKNLEDATQKVKLFGEIRRDKSVIDHWLSTCVFPFESKQFPGKLVMTAWDLCYEGQENPITGFSGTNDCSILLPLMITQQDLPSLQNTNDETEMKLCSIQNSNHQRLMMAATCEDILTRMTRENLQILIDAGALMLDLHKNEQVAEVWLQLNPKIKAVVYFSLENDLMVKSRRGQDTLFDVSPYKERLGECGVFLDDQHTRGTDLKFPEGSKACVTVGSRMKRDKLIQACWRMRKIGNGHSVTFYLSHEAHGKIVEMEGKNWAGNISTEAVLKWVRKNTNEYNEDGLLYWALAGRNYAQRLAAEDNFNFPSRDLSLEVKTDILANQCMDDEILSLQSMYGQYSKEEMLKILIPKWFEMTKRKLKDKNQGQELIPEIIEKIDSIAERCASRAGNRKAVTSMMEEEQEKELEMEKEVDVELEEERVKISPPKFEHLKPSLHANVKTAVIDGGPFEEKDGIMFLPYIFRKTTFWSEVEPSKWGNDVFVSQDFCFVIKKTPDNSVYFKTDYHLRPVTFLVSWRLPTDDVQLLVLSPYEVNELMPSFRNGEAKCTLHMISARRAENQNLLLNNQRLQLPQSELNHNEDMIVSHCRGTLALLLASGNLYFGSDEEKKWFSKFIRLDARQRIHEFDTNKSLLVKKILSCRHTVVSDLSHIVYLLNGKHIHFYSK